MGTWPGQGSGSSGAATIPGIPGLIPSIWPLNPGSSYDPLIQSVGPFRKPVSTWAVVAGQGIAGSGATTASGYLDLNANFQDNPDGLSRMDIVMNLRQTKGSRLIVGGQGPSFSPTIQLEPYADAVVSYALASPAVMALTFAHNLTDGDPIKFSAFTMSSGSTAVVAGTQYFAKITGVGTPGTHFAVYLDQGLTQPLDTTGDGTYTANSGFTSLFKMTPIGVGTAGNQLFTTQNFPLADNTRICASFCCFNGVLTSSLHLTGSQAAALAINNPLRTAIYSFTPISTVVSSHPISNQLYSIFLKSVSTGTADSSVVGYWANLGGLDGPPDGVLATRSMIANPYQDNLSWLFLPERSSGWLTPQDMVVVCHQNLGTQDSFLKITSANFDAGATFEALASNGYAMLASNGDVQALGSNPASPGTNQAMGAAGFGNPLSLFKQKQLVDLWRKSVTYPRNLYGVGMSMGGVQLLNFAAKYANEFKAIQLVNPVTDLAESGLTGAPASLNVAVNNAYATYVVSIASANVGNTPNTQSDTAFWKVCGPPGGLPGVGDIGPNLTSVSPGATSATQTVGDTSRMIPGMWLYFSILRVWARVESIASSTSVVLQNSIVTTTGELVNAWFPNIPYGSQYNANWGKDSTVRTGNNFVYNAGTTYAIGQIVMVISSHADDMNPSNPKLAPEKYAPLGTYPGLPIQVNYGASCAVSAATAATPPILTTTSSPTNLHGLVDGTPVLLSAMAGGTWSTLNGIVKYAKVSSIGSTTTFGLYDDAGLTTPTNASGLGTYTGASGSVSTPLGGNDTILDFLQTTAFVSAVAGISGLSPIKTFGNFGLSGFTAATSNTFQTKYGTSMVVNYMGTVTHDAAAMFNAASTLSFFQAHV